VREVEAHAARRPAYLCPKTLSNLNAAVARAATLLAKAKHKQAINRGRQRLFYLTARRDAFKLVLTDTQPSAAILRPRRPPGVATKLAAWRYEIRWRERAITSHSEMYQELRAQYERRRQTYDQARAQLAILVDDQDAELILRRKSNPNARTPRELSAKLKGMRDVVRTARRALREVEGDYRTAKAKLRGMRDRVALLVARIEQKENYK
jgi:chromosome segregation ATPase